MFTTTQDLSNNAITIDRLRFFFGSFFINRIFTFDQHILVIEQDDFHSLVRDVCVLQVIGHMNRMHDGCDFELMF